MGCGESKHDVATGNTITRKKSNGGEQSKKSKDTGTVLENASLLVQQQEEGDDQIVKNNNNKEPIGSDQVAVADQKGSLITKESPDRYFSSRKEEESIDGVDGRSEYDSPRPKTGKESLFNDDNEKVDDSNAVEEEKMAETKNAEGVISEKKVEDLAKGTEKETAAAIEVEASAVSTPAASAEKNLENAEKEQEKSVASPSKE